MYMYLGAGVDALEDSTSTKLLASSGIRSRNVTMNLEIKFPTAADAPQPFRLRVVQCWIKSPMVGYNQAITATSSGQVVVHVLGSRMYFVVRSYEYSRAPVHHVRLIRYTHRPDVCVHLC